MHVQTHKGNFKYYGLFCITVHIGINDLFFTCHLTPLHQSKYDLVKALQISRIKKPLVQFF